MAPTTKKHFSLTGERSTGNQNFIRSRKASCISSFTIFPTYSWTPYVFSGNQNSGFAMIAAAVSCYVLCTDPYFTAYAPQAKTYLRSMVCFSVQKCMWAALAWFGFPIVIVFTVGLLDNLMNAKTCTYALAVLYGLASSAIPVSIKPEWFVFALMKHSSSCQKLYCFIPVQYW